MARTYTDADRERGIAAVEMAGGSIRKASRDLGIPIGTLQRWVRTPLEAPLAAPPEVYAAVYADTRTQKKCEVIAAAWDVAVAAFQRAIEALPEANARDAATVAGIAVDKAQLLAGGATNRVDFRALLATLPPELGSEVGRLLTAAPDGGG